MSMLFFICPLACKSLFLYYQTRNVSTYLRAISSTHNASFLNYFIIGVHLFMSCGNNQILTYLCMVYLSIFGFETSLDANQDFSHKRCLTCFWFKCCYRYSCWLSFFLRWLISSCRKNSVFVALNGFKSRCSWILGDGLFREASALVWNELHTYSLTN